MSAMSESEFNQLIDKVLMGIEEALDVCEVDIDYETAGGVMTLEFENRSQIILNRQTPLRQLWLACKAGGFHFDYVEGRWLRDSDGADFFAVLNQACSEQAGSPVVLSV